MRPCVAASAALPSTVNRVPLTLEKMETFSFSLFGLKEPTEEHSLNIEEIIAY